MIKLSNEEEQKLLKELVLGHKREMHDKIHMNRCKTNELSRDFVRMYYEHQYNRIEKLQDQRLSITGAVITLSTFAFTFGFVYLQSLTLITGMMLPVIMIVMNVFAIAYIRFSIKYIEIYRMRANRVLEIYCHEILEINKIIPLKPSGLSFGITEMQTLIHILLILASLFPLYTFLF